MKRIAFFLLILLLTLSLIVLFSTSVVKRSSFYEEDYYKQTLSEIDSLRKVVSIINDTVYAGFSKISITPKLIGSEDNTAEGEFANVPLAGFGSRKGKPATGVHDSIFVKAVALRVGGQISVIIGTDLLILPPNITDSVVSALSKKGITREPLFFSATHTHSSLGGWGPGFVGTQFAGKENQNLQKWLVNQISGAVIKALDDIRPAKIGSGIFNAENLTRNRAVGESGTKNNDFSFFFIEQIGYRKAVIGSYSAHSTTMGDKNMEISADYPGYWSRKMESASADLAIFIAGSIGSQSPRTDGEGFEKPKNLGEALADSLILHLSGASTNETVRFSAISLRMRLPEYHIRLTKSLSLSSFWSNKLMPEPKNVYLQAIRIDNMVWITTPSDFSGEYALQIKNSLAAQGFLSNITSFNGSYVGYIVPGKYFYLDEYESKMMGWFGPEMGDYTIEMIRQILRIVTQKNNI